MELASSGLWGYRGSVGIVAVYGSDSWGLGFRD